MGWQLLKLGWQSDFPKSRGQVCGSDVHRSTGSLATLEPAELRQRPGRTRNKVSSETWVHQQLHPHVWGSMKMVSPSQPRRVERRTRRRRPADGHGAVRIRLHALHRGSYLAKDCLALAPPTSSSLTPIVVRMFKGPTKSMQQCAVRNLLGHQWTSIFILKLNYTWMDGVFWLCDLWRKLDHLDFNLGCRWVNRV